ncbi:N-6 DNA methylase [Streptomyces rimosus]|uniref:N-6 DNA methylase n=1 Tax=Streptomyces rimosus TaxID=1927 RepID=UPI0004CB3D53|nr:N-6 DNA methylase [Streptomyces rimosus]
MTQQLDLFADLQPAPMPPQPKTPVTFAAKPSRSTTAPSPAPRPAKKQPSTPARPRTISVRPASAPHAQAMQIGEAVAGAWHRQHGGNHVNVPIGIVAALSLIGQKDPNGPDLATQILSLNDTNLIGMYREIWSTHWFQRPDLIDRARILHEWLNDTDVDKNRISAVRAVTEAALKNGLLTLTGYADPYLRSMTDVLSPVMILLRSRGAQQGLGEFHTPASVAETMAEIMGFNTLDIMMTTTEAGQPQPGQHIHDPAGGSGGLLRAAAQNLREKHLDPADFQWSMCDIDEIAAACAAVNAIIWGLGPRVTVACADILTNPRAIEDAVEHARAVIEHRNSVLGKAKVIAAIQRPQQLLNQAVERAA